MKKSTSVALACGLILMVGAIASSQVAAKSDDHKILRKWDLNGSFVAYPGYNWGGLKEGATWNYSIHIKEAVDGEYSVGSVHFVSGDVSVVGIVKGTRYEYPYWSKPNLFAYGTANYEGTKYNFMFLYHATAMWFALSQVDFEPYLSAGSVWPGGQRVYQLHSKGASFPWNPKKVH